MVAMDPFTPIIVQISLVIIIMALFLRYFKMPSVVTYILAGVALGPFGLNLIKNESTISTLGTLGVILLLFFLGMEISIKKLMRQWKVTFIGGLFQVLLSFIFVGILSYFSGWDIKTVILYSFILTLSSTAVVIKVLDNFKEINSRVGQKVINILIFQDIIVIVMIIILGFFGSELPSKSTIILQLIGFALVSSLIYYINKKGSISIPLMKKFAKDHEMQIFLALIMCFGFAMLSALFEISTALGAFIAGIVIAHSRESKWVHDALQPLHIVFVAIFFISIGLLIDVPFIFENYEYILLLVGFAFIANSIINTVILKMSNLSFGESIYGGVLLSQIGEFSFILASIGIQIGAITEANYDTIISVISLSLLLTAPIVILVRNYLYKKQILAV